MKFSSKEKKMLKTLGVTDVVLQYCNSQNCYEMASENVLVDELTGPAVDSLRRCMKAFRDDNTPFRGTPEFERLIQLD